MYDKIKNDIVNALKEKDTLKLQTLRGIKGEVDLEHINKKVEINDDLGLTILSRGIKTKSEIELLQTYLPKQLSDEEINEILDNAFSKVNPTSQKDMGLIMREVTPILKGKADMGKVSNLIKERLSNL